MQLAGIDPLVDTADVHVRIYRCAACDHEMRLTVWADAQTDCPSGSSDPSTLPDCDSLRGEFRI
jgi:hypothetical protein